MSRHRHEFWQGWHITLNEWFRDYFFFWVIKWDRRRLYTDLILLTTFLLIALWHQLSWVMLIWGLCNATWIILEKRWGIPKWIERYDLNYVGILYHLAFASVLATIFIAPSPIGWIENIVAPFHLPDSVTLKGKLLNIGAVALGFGVMHYYYRRAGAATIEAYFSTLSWVKQGWLVWLLALGVVVLGNATPLNNYYLQF